MALSSEKLSLFALTETRTALFHPESMDSRQNSAPGLLPQMAGGGPQGSSTPGTVPAPLGMLSASAALFLSAQDEAPPELDIPEPPSSTAPRPRRPAPGQCKEGRNGGSCRDSLLLYCVLWRTRAGGHPCFFWGAGIKRGGNTATAALRTGQNKARGPLFAFS